jgi:hypothetical protein
LGVGDFENRIIPTLIPILNNIKQISAGAVNSMVLNNDKKYLSFGSNFVKN